MRINFAGDGFCRKGGYGSSKNSELAWTTLLAEKLKASIVGLGKQGSSIEHAFTTFRPDVEINVFCWTEYERLYHPYYSISRQETQKQLEFNKVHEAADAYYKHLHCKKEAKRRSQRSLYWFDHSVLKNYKGIAIHAWSYKRIYEFEHGITCYRTLNRLRHDSHEHEIANHLTEQQNKDVANIIYELIIDAKSNTMHSS